MNHRNSEQELREKMERLRHLEKMSSKKPSLSKKLKNLPLINIIHWIFTLVMVVVIIWLFVQGIMLQNQYQSLKRDFRIMEQENRKLASIIRETQPTTSNSSNPIQMETSGE